MSRSIPINVDCYSGYKADEYPKRFYLFSMEFEITDVTDRWYQSESSPGFPVSNYFKVITDDGKNFILKHQIDLNKWFLLVRGEAIHIDQ